MGLILRVPGVIVGPFWDLPTLSTRHQPQPLTGRNQCTDQLNGNITPLRFCNEQPHSSAAPSPPNALWQEPTAGLSGVETHEGVLYMVLRNNKGILAVFQILDEEEMEQLDQWPSEISEEA